MSVWGKSDRKNGEGERTLQQSCRRDGEGVVDEQCQTPAGAVAELEDGANQRTEAPTSGDGAFRTRASW